MQAEPSCATCERLVVGDQFTCAAYPESIPDAIIVGWHDHREPYKGDQGIRYEKVKP